MVGSALSDPYLSYAASMCGLAGPLHGLANQEVLMWIMDLVKSKSISPSDDQVLQFVKETLDSGRVRERTLYNFQIFGQFFSFTVHIRRYRLYLVSVTQCFERPIPATCVNEILP